VTERVRVVTPASPEEAAAIVAAVERFLRDHAAPAAPARVSPWVRAARLEAVGATGRPPGLQPWGDGHPWAGSA
jgi:hypothetical protein